jgi:hypothetical protein
MELCSGGTSLAEALQKARSAHSQLQWEQQQQQQQQPQPQPQPQRQLNWRTQATPVDSDSRQLLAWHTRIELLRQAASVLAFMHQMPPLPLLHNDLRADNMLLHDDKHKGWMLKVTRKDTYACIASVALPAMLSQLALPVVLTKADCCSMTDQSPNGCLQDTL